MMDALTGGFAPVVGAATALLASLLDRLFGFNRWERMVHNVLSRWGVSLSFGSCSWETAALNDHIYRVGSTPSKLLRLWFAVGTFFGIAGLFGSLLYLAYILFASVLFPMNPNNSRLVVPVIPGLTLPLADLPFVWVAILVSVAWHEFGHALAAAGERVRARRIGFFMVILFPGAYVSMEDDLRKVLRPWQQLRVYCAGAWHNAVLGMVCVALLASMPYALAPAYESGSGVAVVGVPKGSLVSGLVMPGDVLVGVDDCTVTSMADWMQCVWDASLAVTTGKGYCFGEGDLPPDSSSECCVPADHTSAVDDGRDSSAAVSVCLHGQSSASRVCMDGADVVGRPRCSTASACGRGTSGSDKLCMEAHGELNDGLLRFHLQNGTSVSYFGHPALLLQSLALSDYALKDTWRDGLLSAELPLYLEKLIGYHLSITSSLAFLNIAPVYLLDGEHVWTSLVEIISSKQFHLVGPRAERDFGCRGLLMVGTALVVSNLVVSLLQFV